MTGFLLSLALRFPRIAAFGLKHRKVMLKILAAGVAVVAIGTAFVFWRNDLVAESKAAGYASAQVEFAQERIKLNAQIQTDNDVMAGMSVAINNLAGRNVANVIHTTAPTIERVTREVYTDPRYRDCTVSDGVLNDLNAARNAIDGISAASAPGGAQ